MKLSSVVQAFGSLCLLLTDGYPVSEDGSPEIIGPDKVQIKTHPGELLVLHCDARTNCEDGVAIIYWLINGAFPDETSKSDRIIESKEGGCNPTEEFAAEECHIRGPEIHLHLYCDKCYWKGPKANKTNNKK